MASARALAKTLAGQPTEVSYGVVPVTVKTPVVPVVVSPPAPDSEGNWTAEVSEQDVQPEFRNQSGQLLGYALTEPKVVNKLTLTKEFPAILPKIISFLNGKNKKQQKKKKRQGETQ